MKKLFAVLALPALLILYPVCALLTLGVMAHDRWSGRDVRRSK